MDNVISRRFRTLLYLLGFTGILWVSSALPGSTQSARTEIRRLDRNLPENVQRYRRNWEVARRDQVLTNGNWLATGPNSMAWMWYSRFGVIYRQYAETISQFVPGTRCGFRVSSGSNIFLDHGRVPGCSQIAGNVRISTYSVASVPSTTNDNASIEAETSAASGYLVFRSPTQRRVIVGALANPPGRPIEVSSLAQQGFSGVDGASVGNSISLTAGQFAVISDNGRIARGEFSLENFYNNSPLAIGLGNGPEDQAYIEELESPEEKELFEEIRTATVDALLAQPRAGAFELQGLNTVEFPDLFPTTPICLLPRVIDGVFSCQN